MLRSKGLHPLHEDVLSTFESEDTLRDWLQVDKDSERVSADDATLETVYFDEPFDYQFPVIRIGASPFYIKNVESQRGFVTVHELYTYEIVARYARFDCGVRFILILDYLIAWANLTSSVDALERAYTSANKGALQKDILDGIVYAMMDYETK